MSMIDPQNLKIFFVGKHAARGHSISQPLTERGYKVDVAEHSNDVFEIIREANPSLVVIDTLAVQEGAYELCGQIKRDKALKDIPVIMLTDFSDKSDAINGLNARADSYLSGSFKPESLVQRVQSLLSASCGPSDSFQFPAIESHYEGKRYLLTPGLNQTVNLFLSTFETAVQQRLELIDAQEMILKLREELDQLILAVKKSDHRFNVLVQMLPYIVYRLDPEGRFVFVNDAVNMLGYKPEDLIGKHFREIIVPEDFTAVSRDHVLPEYVGKVTGPEAAPKLFDERRTGNRMTRNLEVRLEPSSSLVRPDDSDSLTSVNGIYAEVNSSGMYDVELKNIEEKQPGQYLGTVGTIRDITERKMAQAALLRSEQKFRMLFETAAGIIILLSPSGIILEWNSEAESVFGLKKQFAIGKYFLDLFKNDQKELLRAASQDALCGRPARDIETPVVNLEGKTLLVLWNITCLPDQDSRSTAIIAVGQDVTQWKQVEEEKSKALSQAEILRVVAETAMETIDGMQDSVLITTTTGVITQINQGFRQTLGWGDDAIGHNIGSYITEGLDQFKRALTDLSPSNPHLENISCSVLTNEGKSMPVLANCTFVDASEKRPSRLILSLRDISRLKEFEKDLKEKNETLELLYGISMAIAGCGSLEELFSRISEAVEKLPILNACSALALFTVDQNEMKLVPSPKHSEEFRKAHENMTIGKCLCGQVAITGKIITCQSSGMEHSCLLESYCPLESKKALVLGLKGKDKVNGVICFSCDAEFEINPRTEKTLHTIAREIGLVMENVRLQEETRSLTITDPLTGVANRRMLEMMLDQALARADRFGQEVSIIMSDIDHFKLYNDTHGHLEGDKALCRVASIFSNVTRKTDLVARYGGEEFVILVPDANLEQATRKADAIRLMILDETPVTISSGVASYRRGADTKEKLLLRADQALYQAKHSGRNAVCASEA